MFGHGRYIRADPLGELTDATLVAAELFDQEEPGRVGQSLDHSGLRLKASFGLSFESPHTW